MCVTCQRQSTLYSSTRVYCVAVCTVRVLVHTGLDPLQRNLFQGTTSRSRVADPSVRSVVRLTSSRLRVTLCVWFLEILWGSRSTWSNRSRRPQLSARGPQAGASGFWLEWPLAGVFGRPPPKRRLQCYYDTYLRHDCAKNEVVRASWGPMHHMATA